MLYLVCAYLLSIFGQETDLQYVHEDSGVPSILPIMPLQVMRMNNANDYHIIMIRLDEI